MKLFWWVLMPVLTIAYLLLGLFNAAGLLAWVAFLVIAAIGGRRYVEMGRDWVLVLTPDGFVYGNAARGRVFRVAAYGDLLDCTWKRAIAYKANDNTSYDILSIIQKWVRTAKLVLIYKAGRRRQWRIPPDFDPSPFTLAEYIVADFHSYVARSYTNSGHTVVESDGRPTGLADVG